MCDLGGTTSCVHQLRSNGASSLLDPRNHGWERVIAAQEGCSGQPWSDSSEELGCVEQEEFGSTEERAGVGSHGTMQLGWVWVLTLGPMSSSCVGWWPWPSPEEP